MDITPFKMRFYEEVFALWQQCEGVGITESDSRDNVQAYLRRNPGLSFVALSSGRIVGAILAGHDGRRGYLNHLAVLPDFRRKGVAKRLVGHSISALHHAGIKKCHLFIFNHNPAGSAFWESVGWKPRRDLQIVSRQITPFSNACYHDRTPAS